VDNYVDNLVIWIKTFKLIEILNLFINIY